MTKKIFLSCFFMCVFFVNASYGQISVSITDMFYSTGGHITNEIIMNSGESVSITFVIDMRKPRNQVVSGHLYTYTKETPASPAMQNAHHGYITTNSFFFDEYYTQSVSVTLNANNFQESGGVLYVAFETDQGRAQLRFVPNYNKKVMSVSHL